MVTRVFGGGAAAVALLSSTSVRCTGKDLLKLCVCVWLGPIWNSGPGLSPKQSHVTTKYARVMDYDGNNQKIVESSKIGRRIYCGQKS